MIHLRYLGLVAAAEASNVQGKGISFFYYSSARVCFLPPKTPVIFLWFKTLRDFWNRNSRQLTTLATLYHVILTRINLTSVKSLNFVQIIYDLSTHHRNIQLFCSNYKLHFCKGNNLPFSLFWVYAVFAVAKNDLDRQATWGCWAVSCEFLWLEKRCPESRSESASYRPEPAAHGIVYDS